MPEPRLASIEVDLGANTFRLLLAGETGLAPGETPATIDIGAGGRLLAVELPALAIDVMPPDAGTEHLARSAAAVARVERAEEGAVAVVLPRRGEGYEITYPSGNQ